MRTEHPGSTKQPIRGIRARVLRVALTVLLCISADSGLRGQPPKKPAESAAQKSKADSGKRTESKPVNASGESPIIYWMDKAGKLFPLLIGKPGQTPEQMLKQLSSKKDPQAAQAPPEGSVTRLVLSGEVHENRADLEATVIVQIIADDTMVPVPLRMAEATLIGDPTYTGPGSSVPGEFQKATGRIWWFRGKGEHRLTLKLSVPVQDRAPSSRIQLSLPQAAFSELNLKVPPHHVPATVQAQDGLSQPVITKEKDSEIKVAGLGTLLDLSWKSLEKATTLAPVLKSDNTILVDFDTGIVFIEARQQIRSLEGRGTFETLNVELPKQAQLRSLQGAEIEHHEADATNPSLIHIRLKAPTHGPVELKWSLEIEHSEEGANITVEGFRVDGAVRENGLIGLKKEADHQLDIDREEMKFVRRVDISEVRKQFTEELDAAFRFSKQPFHFKVATRTVEPQSTVFPKMVLTVSETGIDYEGFFEYRVASGTIETVIIDWPDWRRNGWTLQPYEADTVTSQRTENGNHITYSLAEGAGASFTVRLKAHRPISSETEAIDFDLPAAKASRRHSAYIIVDRQDNVEVKFNPEGETIAQLLAAPLPESLLSLIAVRDRQPIAYEVDSSPLRFTGLVTVHLPSIQTSTVVKLNSENQKTASVRQTISYTAAWGRLASISLLVPDSIHDKVKLFSGTTPLTGMNWKKAEQPDWQHLTLKLDKPRIGRFEVHAEFDVSGSMPPGSGQDHPLSLPVIRPFNGSHVTTHFESSRTGNISARIEAENWKPQTDARGTPTWSTDKDVREIPIVATRGGETVREDISISRAYIRTTVDTAGNAQNIAHYLLTQIPAQFDVSLPTTVERGSFEWDGQEFTEEQISASKLVPGSYRVTPPVSDQKNHVLSIRFQVATGLPLTWGNRIQLPAPRIANETWVTQSIWEIILPENQLFFTDPSGFTSQNRWRREGLGGTLWVRVPEQTSDELQQWITQNDVQSGESLSASGNRYQFARIGPVRRMSFQTMSWPMIVGIGSGLSLVLGLMFQYVRGVRNVLTLLAIAFVTAVVGIWHTNAVLLLLQASVLGLTLALISSLIQGLIRRRRSAVVTVRPASGFLAGGGSSLDHEVIVPAGSQYPNGLPGSSEAKGGLVSSSTITGADQQ